MEVAVPQSIWNLLWQHWVKVLYLLDIGFILGGLVLGNDAVTRFGWAALAVTLGLHLVVNALTDFISGVIKGFWLRAVKALVGITLIVLLAGGRLVYFYEWAFGPVDLQPKGTIVGVAALIVLGVLLAVSLPVLGFLLGLEFFRRIKQKRS